MISYKDKEKIKRYTQNIVANEDADYTIFVKMCLKLTLINKELT